MSQHYVWFVARFSPAEPLWMYFRPGRCMSPPFASLTDWAIGPSPKPFTPSIGSVHSDHFVHFARPPVTRRDQRCRVHMGLMETGANRTGSDRPWMRMAVHIAPGMSWTFMVHVCFWRRMTMRWPLCHVLPFYFTVLRQNTDRFHRDSHSMG